MITLVGRLSKGVKQSLQRRYTRVFLVVLSILLAYMVGRFAYIFLGC